MKTIEEVVEEWREKMRMFDDDSEEDWLTQTLKERDQQIRDDLISELDGVVEGLRADGETPFGRQELDRTEISYNQALDDIKEALNNLKNDL